MQRRNHPNNLAVYQAAAAQAQQRGGSIMNNEEAALLLQQRTEAITGGTGELKLTRELIECLAMAQGMQDGLAGLGLDASTLEYLPNKHLIRSFCTSIPIPFSAFDGIRRSKHKVELTQAQEENVLKSFEKLVKPQEDKGQGSSSRLTKEISVPLPFVSAFFDQRCPELRNGVLANSRSGATYLLLSVITGHQGLCSRCLKAGANPNNMSFLRDENPQLGEMMHGYSPMFIAVLAEQIAVMDLLSSCGGSVHVYDRWGRTPLHAAVAMNSVEVVQWLLAKGAPRYVGDCLNLVPAESAEEDYFPELAMPNLALRGTPPKPPLSYFLEASGQSARGGEQDGEKATNETEGKASGKDEAGAGAASVTAAEAAAARQFSHIDKDDPDRKLQLCHCHSGRPSGYCGCVDDMYMRWSLDRLTSTWSRGVDYAGLAQRQNAVEEQKRQTTTNRRRK